MGVATVHGRVGDNGILLVLDPGDRAGRVSVVDGRVQVGALHVLARGTANVRRGLRGGTFRVVGPALGELGSIQKGTRHVVTGRFSCR